MQYIPEIIVNAKITVELVHKLPYGRFRIWPLAFSLIQNTVKNWHFSDNFRKICIFGDGNSDNHMIYHDLLLSNFTKFSSTFLQKKFLAIMITFVLISHQLTLPFPDLPNTDINLVKELFVLFIQRFKQSRVQHN